ncbi:MAG: hotdog domain-containing protein [Actinomycetota bacterium]
MIVREADTAVALRSGDVPVLGTPRLLALAEEATVAALAGRRAPGETTVGTAVTIQHRRASPAGSHMSATAELTGVDGRRLTFSFTVHHEVPCHQQSVATGAIERVVVSRKAFLASLPPQS